MANITIPGDYGYVAVAAGFIGLVQLGHSGNHSNIYS